jgi:hypothetical protein
MAEKRKIWRVKDSEGNLEQVLVETSAEQVVVTPKDGIIKATNVQAAIEEIAGVAATGGVTSVNGKTGAVELSASDIGLGNVDNTADADKNVNSAVKDGSKRVIVDTYATKQELQDGLAGKSATKTYENYNAFVTAVMGMDATALKVGDNILIKQLNVPDMWVYKVSETKVTYTYTDDVNIILELAKDAGLVVGHYTFAKLETQKVDLSEYQTKTDNSLTTTKKTVVEGINELKSIIDDVIDGDTPVEKADTATLATSAGKLSTAVQIALKGVVGGSASTDFSENVEISTTIADESITASKLEDSGVEEGDYTAVKVDTKGRVIAGGNAFEWGIKNTDGTSSKPSANLMVGGIFFELQ